MNVYVIGAYPDIKAKKDLLEKLKKDPKIAAKIASGDLVFQDMGASATYTKTYNIDNYGTFTNAKELSKAIGDSYDIGIIFCQSGIGAENYSAMYPNLVTGFVENAKHAKAVRKTGANVLHFSSKYSIKVFEKAKAFILAIPDVNNKQYQETTQKLKGRFERKKKEERQ